MSTVMKTTRDVRGVGLSIPRPDGPEKVTGHVQYVADIKPKGLLHAKLLRSPHAHARIRCVDPSAALRLPGVLAVLTGAEAAGLAGPIRAVREVPGYRETVMPIIAADRVRFSGQIVAVLVENGEPVEFGQPLFKVDTRK